MFSVITVYGHPNEKLRDTHNWNVEILFYTILFNLAVMCFYIN